jgi:Zn-dependent protease
MGVNYFSLYSGHCLGKMPVNPSRFRKPKIGNIFVSVAGPLLNLALAILFIIVFKLNMGGSSVKIWSCEFLYLAAYINLSLFMFNMLPIPPLDGFHVCSEFFPELKALENNPLGLLALTFLLTSGLSEGMSILANGVLCTAIPLLQECHSLL